MATTLETVQQLAPDQASLKAASGLLKPSKWPLLAQEPARGLAWGECQGSGATPYRVCATLDDQGYHCSCPSRKFPCKHSLALLWIAADRGAQLTEGTAPGWVDEWLARRRPRSAPAPRPAGDKDIASATEAVPEVDPARAAAAARAAEKRREDREASVAAGLDELDLWLADALGEGLGAFAGKAVERCRRIAARLVDAKAGTLATRLDELPGALFALPDDARTAWLTGELGRIALLVRAYRRIDALPAELAHDVRRLIGWTTTREAVLEDARALTVRDAWTVLATRAVTQSDRLVRHETWLRRHASAEPDFALFLDFVPVAGGAAPSFRAGEVLTAELVFHPSAVPLRAVIGRADPEAPAAQPTAALHGGHPGLDAATKVAHRQLARQPWLDPVPTVVRDARVGRVGDRFLVTTGDGAALAVVDPDRAALTALAAGGPATVALLLEAGGARVLAADTPLGWWAA